MNDDLLVNCQTCTKLFTLESARRSVSVFLMSDDGSSTVYCCDCTKRDGKPKGAIVYCIGCLVDGYGLNALPVYVDGRRTRQWENICADCEVDLMR